MSKDGLIKKFLRIYKFCNDNFNKFILLLRKGVHPYEYMGSWERFDETLLPDKKAFYSELNLEDITDVSVYPFEYMDSWERFDETLSSDKKVFYSELNLEDITDKYYEHGQKVFEVFRIKNLGEYHDLYVQSDTLLLAGMFENFRDKCI